MERPLRLFVGKFNLLNWGGKFFAVVSLLILGGFYSNSLAQINITIDQFRAILAPGQTHFYTNSDSALQTVNIGNSGGPNLYDFSNVNLPDYELSNNYYVSSIPKLVSRYPSNAVTFGESPDLVENNPVFLFGQDTVFVLGNATVTTPEYYKHYIPYQVLGVFPLAYGHSFSQSITAYDTLFTSSGSINSNNTYIVNNITAIDGYGTLKINDFQAECLRIKLDHTDMGDKEFIYMTQAGIFVNVIIPSSEPDFGDVQVSYMRVLISYDLTNIEEIGKDVPDEYLLSQNYPNPFNPSTKIRFMIREGGNTSIKVYDLLGNEVSTLVDRYLGRGEYEIEFNAEHLTAGVYFYQFISGGYVETKKLIFLK
ncbi:T9SS type A sorting domain-containing protein [Bacteroidota bacterium]